MRVGHHYGVDAIAIGQRLRDLDRPPTHLRLQRRRAGESRAALAAGIGVILLLVAVNFRVSYLIFGPIHDYVSELVNPGGGD